eukprot:g10470.t1
MHRPEGRHSGVKADQDRPADLADSDLESVERLGAAFNKVVAEIQKVIVGQKRVIEELMISMLSGGHCLLVGVPGLAKTLMVRTLADTLGLSFSRIQFTPDLMPADITGTEVIQEDKSSGARDFRFLKGPVFANVVLADEINRTPPKTQAALLEAMQERQVTTGGKRHALPEPFFVLATQNPIEQEGTYPLPEAQLDRFMFEVFVDYPDEEEEFEIVRQTTSESVQTADEVLSLEELADLQATVRRVPVADHVIRYAMQFARLTRPEKEGAPDFVKEYISWGAGPRASQFLILGGKARAMLHGRAYVGCEDVRAVAAPVLRHRIVTNFNAEAENLKPDDIVARLTAMIPTDPTEGGLGRGISKIFKSGFSVEFAEHREYVPGDDLRYVDWKVFGKSDRYYLKRFEEDTNFSCFILLDTSESMNYKSEAAAVSKLEYAKMIAAALAHLVVRQQDAVGLATFDRGVTNFIRPSSRPSHLNQLYQVMEDCQGKGETAIGPILHELAERIRKRGLVIILSDLFDEPDSLAQGLKHFRHRRHDVSVLQVIDPAEQDFTFEDPTLFKGLEGLPDQMADPRSLRAAYKNEFEDFLWQVRGGCRKLNMDHFLLRTDQHSSAQTHSRRGMNFPVSHPILAFGFTLPMLLWGIALGGIPIIIHLLHKRKYRETSWAAMRFLLEAARKNSRRVRLEQLLLLTVRTLILLFLVGALQGMYFETTSTQIEQQGPTHHVIVIDASFSMGFQENPQATRFENARKTALRIVDAAQPGDYINLALITGPSKRVVISKPAHSRQWIRRQFEQAARAPADNDVLDPAAAAIGVSQTATHELGRLMPTLSDVGQLLKRTELPRKKVYLISDFQKTTWEPKSSIQRTRIRESMKNLSKDASLVLVNVGNREFANAAVTRIETETPYAIYGQPVQLYATVRNFGSTRLEAQSLQFYVDGKLSDKRSIDLDPNSQKRVLLSYPPENAPSSVPKLDVGEHFVEVRLENDRLPLDNVRGMSLPVKDEIRVLLVDGNPGVSSQENATSFISKALRPTTKKQDWQGIIRPKIITEAAFIGTDLSSVDCVFLCNVASFQQSEARKLKAYVESGGGLVVCMGPQARLENYNAVLYREGNGVLPVKIRDHIQRYRNGDSFQLDTSKLNHPILDAFRGNPGSGLDSVFCRRYFRTEIPKNSDAQTVLRFQNTNNSGDDPVLIASPLGQGRTLLFTTSFDAASTTWSASISFVPLINEVVTYAIAGRWNRRQYSVGEPLDRGFPAVGANVPPTVGVRRPDGTVVQVGIGDRNRWRTKRDGAELFDTPPEKKAKSRIGKPNERVPPHTQVRKIESRDDFVLVQWNGRTGWVDTSQLERIGYAGLFFTETLSRGAYELLLRPPLGRREIYAVNVDRRESDLTPISEKQLRADVLSGVSFDFRNDWRDNTSSSQTAGTQQSSMTRWLLIAVLCLIVVEQLMAWKFLPGFLLLAALIASEFCRQAFSHDATTGVVTATVMVAGGVVVFFLLRRRRRQTGRRRRAMLTPAETRQ